MALRPMSAGELADTPTVFSSFMGSRDKGHRTLGQLLSIYRERSRAIRPEEDLADDLRVERFKDDMADRRWRDDVIIRIGEFDGKVLVIDGIHRGLAYLACVEAGISPDRLPPLHVAV
jgi:hypothetical protein